MKVAFDAPGFTLLTAMSILLVCFPVRHLLRDWIMQAGVGDDSSEEQVPSSVVDRAGGSG